MSVVLRYFEAQGRAQSLRNALTDAGIPFEDARVTLAMWPPNREDPSFGGLFAALPTLTWDGETISETLAIATYVSKRLGHYDGLDAAQIAKLEAVISCCYQDVVRRISDTMWAPMLFPGADVVATAQRQLGSALAKLDRISALLPDGEAWLGGARPAVADFFVGETVELVRKVLGSERDVRLRERVPRAFVHAERLRERPGVAKAWATRPANFTMSPDEPGAMDRIRACDLSSIGL
jgi:glutathione S-transferase